MSDLEQIDWPEVVAHLMTGALCEIGILENGDGQSEQKARMALAKILRRYCLPQPAEPRQPTPSMQDLIKAGLQVIEARERLVALKERTIEAETEYAQLRAQLDISSAIIKAIGLEPPQAAGLYPTYPEDDQEG